MTTCVVNIYSEPGQHELDDTLYQCSIMCMRSAVETESGLRDIEDAGEADTDDGSISWGRLPGGAETQSDVHCSTCEDLLWRGLSHYEQLAEMQRRAEDIVRDTEHLRDIAAEGDADALENAFREALLPEWPGHQGINPNKLDYDAIIQRFTPA